LVVDKLVVVVIAVIGEHEVESVPKIPRRPIAGHVNSGRELEINPVPMAGYDVAPDVNVGRVPQVDSVARLRLPALRGSEYVVLDRATRCACEVDAEEAVVDPVAGNTAVRGPFDADGRSIVHEARRHALQGQVFDGDVIRENGDDLIAFHRFDHGALFTPDSQRFV